MNNLKQKLEEKHITQGEMAKRCGVLSSTINRYCNNKNKKSMSLELAVNIAKVLDIDIKEFIEEIMK